MSDTPKIKVFPNQADFVEQEQMVEQHTETTAHVEMPDGHASALDHVNLGDLATQYWWVGAIFIVGLLFSAKAAWRVALKIPFIKVIIDMWKKS